MLDEKKIEAITLLMSGKNKSDVAKIVGVGRQTIYSWLENKEFTEEMQRMREELVQAGNEKLASRLDIYIDELHNLAMTSTDKRTKASCLMYLTDRILGKAPATVLSKNDNTNNINVTLIDDEPENNINLVESEE